MAVTIGARAGDVNATLDHTAGAQWGSNTGASTVDAEKEHYNNDAATAWAGCAYAKFSFSIPEGHSITKATLKYSVNQGGNSGRNDIIYYMSKDFDLEWTTFAGQTGTDLRNTENRAGKAVEAAATGGKGDRIGLSQDVTTAVKAIYEAGQSYIIFQWTGNAGGADLYGKASSNAPTLVIATTDEVLYEATFNANDGAITPTVTVYSDAERKTTIAKNSLLANTTYYFTATLAGYQDYNGDFAVETSNPTVNFTMTAKSVFNYTVNAVDDSDNSLGQVNSGSGYEGEEATYYYPQFILNGTTLYVKNKNGVNPFWGATGTLDADNKIFTVKYGDGTIENVVFYKEAEDIEGFTAKTTNNATIRCSNGTGGIAADEVTLTTLEAGKYKITGQVWGTAGVTAGVKAGETDLWTLESTGSLVSSTSDEFEIAESTELKVYTTGANDNRMLDLLYIVKTGEYTPPLPTFYAVNIAEGIENGTVEVNPTSSDAGAAVTVTATPAEGYELESITVTGATSSQPVTVTDGKFTMPAEDVTVTATFKEKAVVPSDDEVVALAADMFYTWDGYGADASKVSVATVDFKLGESVDAGATVAGTGTVDYLTYADMTGSTKAIFEGKDGTVIRLLMNRQESNNGPLVEKMATIADGKAEISLTDLTYVHVNAIKIPYNGSTGNIISAIKFVKPNDPLAVDKEALKDAIAAAKMQNSVAKTEDSFAALTKAITDAEAALANAQATKESLGAAKADVEAAVKGLTLAEGYSELTKEMFMQYASVEEPGEGTSTGGSYELFKASGLPYGDGNVSELKWADLTKYDQLIVTVAGTVAPRLCLNRLVANGQQAATQEDSKLLDINPNNGNTWSTVKYQTAENGVYTIDLAAIVKDYGFARLHCIKAQGGGSTVVTGMYLHEAPSASGYAVKIAEGIEGGTVVANPASAEAGTEVTVTATPAAGYELVSVSVTGVKSNEAITVTDGKFTMPADDVTVNAEFQKKVIYIETDLTAKFNSLATTQWTGSSGQVGWAAPKVMTNSGLEVAAWERYGGSCDWTGDIMSSSVTGLTPGTYKIELYGAAAFTFGRGFGSTAFTGDFTKDSSETYKENESITENTGVTLFAETSEGKVAKEIPIWYATNFNTSGIATAVLENVIVGESGEIKIGLSKTSTSTNWHVVQLKGVTAQVRADELLDNVVASAKAIEENTIPAKAYTALQAAIAENDKAYETADEYLAAITAVNNAMAAANAFVAPYAAWNEVKPIAEAVGVTLADISDMTAEELTAATQDLYVDMYHHTTNNLSDDSSLLGEWTGAPGTNQGESWDGSATDTYYDAWNKDPFAMTQTVTLPAGKYVLMLKARASVGATINMTDGVTTVDLPTNSSVGLGIQIDGMPSYSPEGTYANENKGRGWEYRFLPIVSDGVTPTTLTFNWDTSNSQWIGIDDIQLFGPQFFDITVAPAENGTVEVAPAKAMAGEEVTITTTPAEGYELTSVTVTGVNTNVAVVVTDGKFTMPEDAVTVTATFTLVTGIDGVAMDDVKADGKYLKKGKLIIVKDGKKFNAAGVAK